jgi:hypothetical protein
MICFDTQPLIWGVQGYATPGQEGMIVRTKKYIESLNAKGVWSSPRKVEPRLRVVRVVRALEFLWR